MGKGVEKYREVRDDIRRRMKDMLEREGIPVRRLKGEG
jgi:hypothetical protein